MILYYILLLLMPFWNYPKLPKFGETFTIIKMVGIVVVLVALVKSVLSGRSAGMFRWMEVRLFVLLFGIAVASAIFVTQGGQWSWPLQTYASVAAYLYTTLVFIDSETKLERACYVVIFSMVLASYSVFSQYVKYGVSRPGGVVGDPNYYALVAVSMLPLAFFLFPTANAVKKAFLGLAGVLLVASILFTGSRGGAVSLGFCLLYSLLRSRKKVLLLACNAVLLIGLLQVLPQTGLDRFLVEDSGTVTSTRARIELLEAGWEMIKARPLTGVGLGMFKPLAAQFNPDLAVTGGIGHNTYLELAAELGIPACLLFVLLLAVGWKRAKRLARLYAGSSATSSRIARALETGIVSYAIGAVFLSAEYGKQIWLLIAFALALASIAAEQQEVAQAQCSNDESQDDQATEPQFVEIRN